LISKKTYELMSEIVPRQPALAADRQARMTEQSAPTLSKLIVSPDNQSRRDLNDVIHRTMHRESQVSRDEHQTTVLAPRQDITGADRQCAERYEEGDVVRYSRGSKALGLEAGDYARVERVDAKANQITVRADDDRRVSCDPRRLQGVTLYRETERGLFWR
jgi:hypothetical protein